MGPPVSDRQTGTIQSLQVGRALAALAVVVHHAALAASGFGGDFALLPVLEHGYLGVDFFFVLSGFIIHHSTVGRGRPWHHYAGARLVRIYLPYWPIGVGLAALYLLLPGVSQADRDWDWLATLTLAPVGTPALSIAWTLQHEVMFYLIFGLLHFTGRLASGLAVWTAAIVALAALGIRDVVAFSLIDLEFIMGVLVAVAVGRGITHRVLPLAGLACFVAWWWFGCQRDLSVIVGLGLALLLPGIIAMERAGRFVLPRIGQFLGAASYSIYLAHRPVVAAAARLADDPWAILALASAAGTLAGIAYHLFAERPLIGLAKRVLARRNAVPQVA